MQWRSPQLGCSDEAQGTCSFSGRLLSGALHLAIGVLHDQGRPRRPPFIVARTEAKYSVSDSGIWTRPTTALNHLERT